MNILRQRIGLLSNSRIQKNFLNALPFWLGAFVTGIVAVLYSKAFVYTEEGMLYLFKLNKWLFFFITPMCFLMSWWVVVRFAPYAGGSGIPQVSAAIELATPIDNHKTDSLLSLRIVFIKIVSALIMVAGGGAVGREGPIVQISGSIFKKINDWLPARYPKISKRNMLVTGAAAGLAAAFNTPLGGIVFAIEELTKTHFSYFRSALLTGVIISGFTALNILGPYLYLGYPQVSIKSGWIIIPVIIVATCSGLLGGFLGKILLFLFAIKKRFRKNASKIGYTLLCGVLLASLAIFINRYAFGSGKDMMETSLFSVDKHVPWYLPLLRFVAPMISFSTGASGGIFAPALSAGASVGALLSEWFRLDGPGANLVILCGMAGFLTGISHSPFTSAIIVLEMTDANDIIFYLMLATLTANIVATLVAKHSFYETLKVQYVREIDLKATQLKNAEADG